MERFNMSSSVRVAWAGVKGRFSKLTDLLSPRTPPPAGELAPPGAGAQVAAPGDGGRAGQGRVMLRPSMPHQRSQPVQRSRSPDWPEVIPTVPPQRQRSPCATLRASFRTVNPGGPSTGRVSLRTNMAPTAMQATSRTKPAVSTYPNCASCGEMYFDGTAWPDRRVVVITHPVMTVPGAAGLR